MILKLFIPNVSETHNLNYPTQGTQCGGKTNCSQPASRRDAIFTNNQNINRIFHQ